MLYVQTHIWRGKAEKHCQARFRAFIYTLTIVHTGANHHIRKWLSGLTCQPRRSVGEIRTVGRLQGQPLCYWRLGGSNQALASSDYHHANHTKKNSINGGKYIIYAFKEASSYGLKSKSIVNNSIFSYWYSAFLFNIRLSFKLYKIRQVTSFNQMRKNVEAYVSFSWDSPFPDCYRKKTSYISNKILTG